MEAERRPCEDDFGSIIEIFQPGLTDFEMKSPERRIRDTFNGTPASALRVMADGTQSGMISATIQWFRYDAPPGPLSDNDDVIDWLQACEDHMYPVYAKSGLYPALGPYFRGALSVGTPAMIMEENLKTKKIECTVPHPRENYFRFDSFGVPVQFHRKFKKTITELVIDLKQRKIDFTAMKATTQASINSGKGGEEIEILQVFYRDDDPIFDGVDGGAIKVSGRLGDIIPQRPWRTYLLEIGADAGVDGKKVPFEARGYNSRPHAVWRYEVGTDEIYARTPAWFSLHDARGEITASKTLMEAAEGYVRPQYLASQDMRGRIRRKPGSTTYKATDKSSVDDMPNSGKNYPIADSERNRMVDNIERWFDVPFYLMLLRNLASSGSPPTATQIIGAEGEQARIRGTRNHRVIGDVLTPIDDRFWQIELEAGRLPEPPDIVLDPEFGFDRVDADFIGSLFQAQKKAAAVRRFAEGKTIIDSFVEVRPELTHKIKWEDYLVKTLESIGHDQTTIQSKDEYAEILADIAQRQQEQEQLETGLAIADAVPKVSKNVEPNSPAAALAGV